MKQALKTTKLIAIGLCTFCTIGLSLPTFASVKTGDPIELKFIGNIKNQPVFQLNLTNDEPAEYFITIKDADLNILYSEKVTGINFSRKYQLAIDESDLKSPDFGLRVEVTSATTHSTEVYKISSNTRVTENIVVAKL